MMPRDMGLSNSVSSHFLMTPCLVTITMNLPATNSFTGRNAVAVSSGCRLIRPEACLPFAGRGGVGNVVNLQPVHAALVGEDQQVGVRGGDDQVLDHVFGARRHADAAFAAARLAAIGVDGGALEIAAARHGDRDVFHLHQVFELDLARVFDDLRAALIAEVLLDFLQLLDDQRRAELSPSPEFPGTRRS